ncbi:hypothetical protein, partial [Staphylococcus aureus]
MSGGSFDYLCWADLVDGYGRVKEMQEALKQYPDSERAIGVTIQILDCMTTIIRNQQRLEDVWHAVEWHHSC